MSYRKNFVGTQKRVRISHGKRAIGVRAIEVRLYKVSVSLRRKGVLLKGTNTFKRGNFVKCSCLLSENRSTPIVGELRVRESPFFRREDPFSDGAWWTGKQTVSNKSGFPCRKRSVSIHLKRQPIFAEWTLLPLVGQVHFKQQSVGLDYYDHHI